MAKAKQKSAVRKNVPQKSEPTTVQRRARMTNIKKAQRARQK